MHNLTLMVFTKSVNSRDDGGKNESPLRFLWVFGDFFILYSCRVNSGRGILCCSNGGDNNTIYLKKFWILLFYFYFFQGFCLTSTPCLCHTDWEIGTYQNKSSKIITCHVLCVISGFNSVALWFRLRIMRIKYYFIISKYQNKFYTRLVHFQSSTD